MKAQLTVILLALGLVIGGCAHQTGGIAPSTIPLAPGSYKILGEVMGRDCVWHLFGLIPLTRSNSTNAAMNKALGRLPGTSALISVSADDYMLWWIVVTQVCTEVRGTAVRVEPAAAGP